MSRGTVFGTAFGLALLAALVVGGYLLLEYVGGVFTSLEPPTRTLAAIGSVVALLSAIIVAEGLKARVRPDQQTDAQRAVTYERLLAACCKRRHRPEFSNTQEATELVAIERSLLLQASASVISAYLKFRRGTHEEASDSTRAALLKELVAEMRRDLGRAGPIRKESDLLALLTEHGGVSKTAYPAGERVVHE